MAERAVAPVAAVGDAPPRGGEFRLCFPAEAFAVRTALRRAVARFARRIPRDSAGTLELVLAEVLNNLVEHGYAGQSRGLIEMELQVDGEAIHCAISDHGREIAGLADGTRATKPCPVPSDLPEGGWGWALIEALTTDLAYRKDGGRNTLSFRVPLAG